MCIISDSLELPCGSVLKNRLFKSAISDSLSDGCGNATSAQMHLYKRWASGGSSLLIVGEVQIDPRFPETPGNLVLGKKSNLEKLRKLAFMGSTNNTHIWPQLSHGGALSHRGISQPKGPSALTIGEFHCEGLSLEEVRSLPQRYAQAAKIAKSTGFTGVQIHAGHGFLLSQFLSPLFNLRKDSYGGSIESRSRIVVEVINRVRKTVGHSFPIGIKINCTDQLTGGLSTDDALQLVKILNNTSIDLIEVSGGSYFPGAKSSSDRSSQGPYFSDFSSKAKSITNIPIALTGGFKVRDDAVKTLKDNSTDMVGLARALILNPNQSREWLQGIDSKAIFPEFENPKPGAITSWFTMLMTALASDNETYFKHDLSSALRQVKERDCLRSTRWINHFRNHI